ncbi:MAG: hypothetical protein JW883_16140 [Deltaproteobacteria bacterium]|nr:hypothetical protein [Deltaproteobacteria bacterium]
MWSFKKLFEKVPINQYVPTRTAWFSLFPQEIRKAYEDLDFKGLTHFQLNLYRPEAKKIMPVAQKIIQSEIKRLEDKGWLEKMPIEFPVEEVLISKQVHDILLLEYKGAAEERRERLGLLVGSKKGRVSEVRDLVLTEELELKGFFKERLERGVILDLEPWQTILENWQKLLPKRAFPIIGTYHTHLFVSRFCPTREDMGVLAANPGMPHLILCGGEVYGYTCKETKRFILRYYIRSALKTRIV